MDYAKKNFVMVIKRFIEVAGGLQQAFGNVRVKWSDVQLLEEHASLGIGGAPDVLASGMFSRRCSRQQLYLLNDSLC